MSPGDNSGTHPRTLSATLPATSSTTQSASSYAKKIRTLVVDDEPLARSSLSVLLRRDPEIEIIGECGSGMEAVAMIRSANPDLVFLDVQMPECDGFDVLEILGVGTSKSKSDSLPRAIVFVTAYDQYALRAFEAGALDYLLKPFDDARFDRALDRAKQQIRQSGSRERANDGTGKLERIAVKSAGSVLFIKVSEIDWIEAADYYVCLHVGPKSYLLRRSMTELEQELPPSDFCRIHRSTIVNLSRVKGLKLGEDGEYEVVLDGGTNLPLSRRHRKQMQEQMGLDGQP